MILLDSKASRFSRHSMLRKCYVIVNQFVLIAIPVLMAAILVMILAKFTAIKTLFWLE